MEIILYFMLFSLLICFFLFVCFVVVSLVCFIFKSSYEIFKISKEYYSYNKYRNDLDYVVYLQEKAEKYNSKELSKKAVWVSKINKNQGD